MEFDKLSKSDAVRLITPVIDDEVSQETRELFFDKLKEYPEVNQAYKSIRGVKQLLKNRYPRAKASDDFHQHVKSIISSHKRESLTDKNNTFDDLSS